MKVAALILTMFLASDSAAGQVLTVKNDIPESQYLAAEAKAGELLKTANYRVIQTKEYFAQRSREAKLQEKLLLEFVQPDKKRTLWEEFYNKPRRNETISDGKASYSRTDNWPWSKDDALANYYETDVEIVPNRNQYKYVPAVEIEGKKAVYYEFIEIRKSNKSSKTDFPTIGYVCTMQLWFLLDGKILKKMEDCALEGRKDRLLWTTVYEYDPKDLKIEAPIK